MFVDVSSRLQVARAITDISQNLVGKGKGNVDVIINAAHAVPMKPYMEREEESMEKLYQTNLTAALLLARHFLPLMLRRSTGGQYVTVVSETMRNHTRAVDASSADYAASQWALVGQHTSLAAWAQQQHQQLKTEGVVHCTLLYASGAQLSYPTPARGASQTANRTKEEQDLVQAAQSAVRAICARRETHGTTPADAFLNTLWALLPVPWFVRCGWVWGGAAKEKEM
ncbi:short-chain dehydrogenase [Angomonas deanei]|uniref:Short chain dehydrogenase/Enoyl-(Acyl carrier protein) reductase, putative n=1 Tax=Angomonas deanei TaxID=59799 RepID=A0A7G2C6S0_9TRYP|nr:short-chain dehydrogenase [Angomonas deanei]CAD2214487.1 short chain dehydrogenase/Enoyl-(Acyl carrier protein) reductase, putative [Angomonas deanei]|eukprot:EPY35772.1 short-chain dehydrogenase [Angomonas deanei]